VSGEIERTGATIAVGASKNSTEVARTLSETREALRQFETSALADVAQTLSEVAESLSRTTTELAATRREEWVDAEGARRHLKRTRKQFERIAPLLPRHYISERGILYNVRELDEWLMDR
jgi:isoaspartyl peptidase/L-asparaginase-like protein (Ntn-hydrolase superfamily)